MRAYTDLTVILDRSGSMTAIKAETITAFNRFVEEQRSVPGEALLTLIQFDDRYEEVFVSVPLKEVQPLTRHTFIPRGWTALIGATCKAIDDTGKRLNSLSKSLRPDKVVIVTLTDSYENWTPHCDWGKSYDKFQLQAKIKHQREVYKWQFVYLGKPFDAEAAATDYGYAKGSAMSWMDETVGGALVGIASPAIASYRTGQTNSIELNK